MEKSLVCCCLCDHFPRYLIRKIVFKGKKSPRWRIFFFALSIILSSFFFLHIVFVYGVYDLIAKIEAEDTDSLKKIVTENLRVLEKVRSTMTMICVDQ